jgi:hypothetical protein
VWDRCPLPAIVEAEDSGLGGHGVEDEAAGVAPAAYHAVFLVLGEATFAQSRFEIVEGAACGDIDDDVDVFGWADGGCTGVGDPQRHRRSADEDDLVEQRAEGAGRELQELDTHAAAAGCASR